MKKKIFFQSSPILYFVVVCILLMPAAGIYVLYDCTVHFIKPLFTDGHIDVTIKDIIAYIGSLFLTPLGIYYAIVLLFNAIILTDNEICVPEEINKKNYKKQLEVHVPYERIRNIKAMYSEKNSEGKRFNHLSDRMYYPIKMPYIVFTLDDDTTKAINVLWYSGRQVRKIVDIAVERARAVGNESILPSGGEIVEGLHKKDRENVKSMFRQRKKTKRNKRKIK